MTRELKPKPCPFCDGEMRIGNYGETLRRLEIPADDSFSISHVDEKLAIERGCPLAIEFFNSREEAIETWNTRADREFRIVEYEIGGTRYIPERTCEQEERGWGTEGDHARVWLTCGHDCMVPTVQDLPRYCPHCGARITEEDTDGRQRD